MSGFRSQHFPAPDSTTVRDEHDEYLHTHGLNGAVENEQACRVGGACSFSAAPRQRPEGDSSSPRGASAPDSPAPPTPSPIDQATMVAAVLRANADALESGVRLDALRLAYRIESDLRFLEAK